jgi:dihydropteroate synthase
LTIQLTHIFYPEVFKRYSNKYNVFRDLHEKDLLALEIRDIEYKLAKSVRNIILSAKEICYLIENEKKVAADILILGSFLVFKELAKEIIAEGNEDLGQKIIRTLSHFSNYESKTINLSGKIFELSQSHIVGILNITPDSFFDGGNYSDKLKAIDHALKMLDSGASIIDIGGESSRPGAEKVELNEELNRVIPVIEEILKRKQDAIISVDTTKSIVAEEALKAGAKIVNDISSFSDENMPEVIKKYDAAVILMHMKGTPQNMQISPIYNDVVSEIYDYLFQKCYYAKKYGINNIIVDPGIGFGKRVVDNFEILKRLNEFVGLGYPILIGVSNKSFIGKSLNLEINERAEATLAAESYAIANGARFIRTHNVKNSVIASKLNMFIQYPELINHG